MGKKLFNTIKTFFHEILDVIYPFEEKCIICKEEGFIGICPNCKLKIKKSRNKVEEFSYGFYGGILKELILQFKYKKDFAAGYVLSQLLLEILVEEKVEADYICYVPMTKKAKKKRGFNQCEIIAKNISRKSGIPICNCIKKVNETKEQKTLGKEARMQNLKGAFSIVKEKNIYKKNIILIDDVMTTGATINECKKILKKSFVNKIIVLTISKSDI